MTPFSQKLLASFKIKLLLTTIGLSSLVLACQANDEVISQEFLTTAKIADLKLELYSQQGQCAIRLNKIASRKTTSQLLAIPYPCGFVRVNKNESAQTYHYEYLTNFLVVVSLC